MFQHACFSRGLTLRRSPPRIASVQGQAVACPRTLGSALISRAIPPGIVPVEIHYVWVIGNFSSKCLQLLEYVLVSSTQVIQHACLSSCFGDRSDMVAPSLSMIKCPVIQKKKFKLSMVLATGRITGAKGGDRRSYFW